ncbi:hypothetical protein [Sulfurimonas sp.]|jgi:hypothetical protein|uniref:hypothetical protein n=1 Tax=Sulfurimonas sp. TaxID=2022749 RepID=UPI002A35928D|nr:hypothetical protein [Sulfurimonas sp.]MDY0123453.1 hypothetical protein [Sulfurimonas sp.]
MYKEAIKKAQSAEIKKVGFNLQIPSNLKSEFENQCKQDNVTVTSMIISLMEVSLIESYLTAISKIESALFDLKKVLNSEAIFIPNPIASDNPMFSKTVSEDEFKKLMKIDLELALGIDEFKEHFKTDIFGEYLYMHEALNMLESARSYIRRISSNMNKKDEFNAVQEEYMDITLKNFKAKGNK